MPERFALEAEHDASKFFFFLALSQSLLGACSRSRGTRKASFSQPGFSEAS